MTEYEVQRIRTAFVRYLLGSGDPFPQRVSGLLDEEILRQNQLDPGYRARRLVKVTSVEYLRARLICHSFILLFSINYLTSLLHNLSDMSMFILFSRLNFLTEVET